MNDIGWRKAREKSFMNASGPRHSFLDKINIPYGQWMPNRIIWGHSLHDFFWIKCKLGMILRTIWSCSMICEWGEGYIDEEHPREPPPRKLGKPWPLLKLPKPLKEESRRNGFGKVDPGSDYNSDGVECFKVLDDVNSDYEERMKALSDQDLFKMLHKSIAFPSCTDSYNCVKSKSKRATTKTGHQVSGRLSSRHSIKMKPHTMDRNLLSLATSMKPISFLD